MAEGSDSTSPKIAKTTRIYIQISNSAEGAKCFVEARAYAGLAAQHLFLKITNTYMLLFFCVSGWSPAEARVCPAAACRCCHPVKLCRSNAAGSFPGLKMHQNRYPKKAQMETAPRPPFFVLFEVSLERVGVELDRVGLGLRGFKIWIGSEVVKDERRMMTTTMTNDE